MKGGNGHGCSRQPASTDSVVGADTHIVMVPSRHRLGSHADPRPRRSRARSRPTRRRTSQIEGSRGGSRRNRGHEQPIAPADARPGVSFQSPPANRGTVSQGSSDRHDQRQGRGPGRRSGAHLQRPDRPRHERHHLRRGDGDDRMTDFLGRGWAFPILPDAGGVLALRRRGRQRRAVAAAAAAPPPPGERVMRPTLRHGGAGASSSRLASEAT